MDVQLIPAPRGVVLTEEGGNHSFTLDRQTVLDSGPGTEGAERWLRGVLTAATGLPLPAAVAHPTGAGQDNRVTLAIDDQLGTEQGPEAYRLTATPVAITITGGGPAGVMWGAQTLRQLLGPNAYRRANPHIGSPAWQVPAIRIQDAPRFAWRGVLLDVARHFLPKADVLRYVDLLATHKLNVLHLHLTDDQGWRMEIKRYPRLTEIGAWRERSMVGWPDAERYDERPHGGYYTQDDLREIVAYAADRHITVVPEIDIPGHTQAAIAAYPELGNTDVIDTTALRTRTDWGVGHNVLNVAESTIRFVEHVLEEVLEIFPARYIHLGGDECPTAQWRESVAAKARVIELGLRDESELQGWLTRHFAAWLAARDRTLIGWDEILDNDIPQGVAVCSWRGDPRAVRAARAGHDVVMSPAASTYLDYREAAGDDEPIPVYFVRTLEDVYRFEPIPVELRDDPDAARRVIGAQACLWTEFIDSVRIMDYRAFPRLAAFAEVAWSELETQPHQRDFAAFQVRMAAHYPRLDAIGVEYRRPDGPRPWQRRPGVAGHPIEGEPPADGTLFMDAAPAGL